MSDPFADQLNAAVAEARGMVTTALGLKDHRPTRGSSDLVKDLWPAIEDRPRCEHLQATPAQPWLLAFPEASWRCRPCHIRWWEAFRAAGLSYGPVEEYACDRCRRHVPPRDENTSGLIPLVIRQDLWTIVASICSECERYAMEHGARSVTRPARPGRNDPCPCRSGRKYKRCCIDGEGGT